MRIGRRGEQGKGAQGGEEKGRRGAKRGREGKEKRDYLQLKFLATPLVAADVVHQAGSLNASVTKRLLAMLTI